MTAINFREFIIIFEMIFEIFENQVTLAVVARLWHHLCYGRSLTNTVNLGPESKWS